jgi:hypothetical protein
VAFKLHKKSNQTELSVNFNLSEGDPFQFVHFVNFFRQAKKENRLILRQAADGKVLLEGPFSTEFETPSDDLMRILRALAEIQLKTGLRLKIPTGVNKDELRRIEKVYQILTKGEIQGQLTSLPVSLTLEEAKHRLEMSKNPDVVENFQATAETSETVELLGAMIPLGKGRIIIQKARIDLKRLSDEVLKGTDPIALEVTAVPDSKVRIIYNDWRRDTQSNGTTNC